MRVVLSGNYTVIEMKMPQSRIDMLTVIQQFYIAILAPVSKFFIKLNERTRAICLQIVCFMFPLFFLYIYMWRHEALIFEPLRSLTAKNIFGCILILFLILLGIDRIPQKVEWNKWLIYPIIICGICMLLLSFHHSVGDGYRVFALMLVFEYPCLYLVWNNRRDYEKLFDPLSLALAVTGVFVFVLCFGVALNGDFLIIGGRCTGPVGNANSLSMLGMFGSCGALYRLVKEKSFGWRFIFYALALGAGYAIVLMGQSRTSIIGCAACLIVTLIFYFRYCEKNGTLLRSVKIFSTIVLVLFMIGLSSACVGIQKAVESNEMGSTTSVGAENEADGQTAADRIKLNEQNKTINTFSSGRITIWKWYFDHLNVYGNDYDNTDWDSLQSSEKRAHNNFLNVAFRYGVPVGILFLFIEFVACFNALQILLLRKVKNVALLMSLLLIVLFFFESVLEIATLPFEREAPCYFYIALISLTGTGQVSIR